MMKTMSVLALAGVCLFALEGTSAQAQATKTWVSGVGDDVNPCSRTAPCKTFPGAISKTAAAGTISVLDPGGFGAVTITKSMSLISDSDEGSILSSSASAGIVINAGPTGIVNVSGVLIEGAGVNGFKGIRILSAKSVVIRNCFIRGHKAAAPNGIGIHIDTNTTTSVFISNCTIENNTDGIVVTPGAGGTANVFLDRVRISKVGDAIRAGNNATVRVHKSAITANTNAIVTTGSGNVFSTQTNAVVGNPANQNFSAPDIALK